MESWSNTRAKYEWRKEGRFSICWCTYRGKEFGRKNMPYRTFTSKG